MQQLAETPVGTPLLWIVGLGMFTLVLWKLLDAFYGHQEEDGGKLWLKRGWTASRRSSTPSSASAPSHCGRLRRRWRRHGLAHQEDHGPAGGQFIVVVIGLAVIAYGGNYVRQAFNEKFREKIAASGPSAAPGKAGNAYVYFGKAGYIAKGIAIGLVGASSRTPASRTRRRSRAASTRPSKRSWTHPRVRSSSC